MHSKILQRISLLCIFFVTTAQLLSAQGIEFFQGSWKEALAEAQAKQKVIFVDGYAVWCGPCKRLSKNVFPQEAVGNYFNANFINVKMDMEKGDGLQFRKKYPLTAFPTLYFIKPNGELIRAAKGAPRTGDALIALAKKALSSYDVSVDYMKKYDAGERDYETMFMLVKSLNKSGKPSLKYANEYLRSQEDLSTEQNLEFLFESLIQLDSRVYDLFLKNISGISKLHSDEEITAKVEKAAWNTVNHSIEYEYRELLVEAQSKYGRINPDGEKTFNIRSDLAYAIAGGHINDILSNMNTGIKADVLTESDCISAVKSVLRNQAGDKKSIKKAERWCDHLLEKKETIEHYLLLADVQQAAGKSQEAAKTMDKCISMAEKAGKSADMYREYKRKILSK